MVFATRWTQDIWEDIPGQMRQRQVDQLTSSTGNYCNLLPIATQRKCKIAISSLRSEANRHAAHA
jgi:hypothetical protein